MTTSTTYTDSRINRSNNMGGYMRMAHDIVLDKIGIDKEFAGGCVMTYDKFETTAYRKDRHDSQICVVMDFNSNTITITVDTPEKSSLEIEMELWETRANDEFGQTLKEIQQACAEYFCAEADEFGIPQTPISHYITLYSMDGNRQQTAKIIRSILEDWDILNEEDQNVKTLVDKMMKLAI